jgi:ATP-binding cassette subfamily B protein
VIKEILQRIQFSFRLVYACSPVYTRWNLALSIGQSFLPLATVYLFKVLIDSITYAAQYPGDTEAIYKVIMLVVLTGLVFLTNTLTDSIKQYFQQKLHQLFHDYMYAQIHDKTTGIDVSYFEDDVYFNLFSRAISNADSKPLQIVESTFAMLHFVLAIASLGALLITLHWIIPLVLLIAALPLGFVKVYYSNFIFRWYKNQTQNERKIWDIHDVLTNPYFSRELRLFGTAEYFRGLFRALRTEMRTGYLKLLRKRILAESFCLIFATLAVFLSLGYISFMAIMGVMTVGGLAMYVMAIHRGVSFFQDLLNSLAAIYENGLYIQYIQDFLALEPRLNSVEEGEDFPVKLKKGIRFEGVSFSYPKSEREAIKNLDLFIPAGKTVAIVGANGAGKSTLVKLICGLYAPKEGNIYFDDLSISEISTQSLRENLGVLFQDFSKYNFSVEENIWFGNPHKPIDSGEIQQAANKAQIHQMIEKLPKSYQTVLGKIYEDSEDISGGEWQKIGLARCFYKDSQVVILDEPTSSMDPEAEYEIFSLFAEMVKEKTAIIISHRFSSVRMADYIYVLGERKLLEEGTHQELMEKKGRYFTMFSRQAEAYVEG